LKLEIGNDPVERNLEIFVCHPERSVWTRSAKSEVEGSPKNVTR